MAHLHVILGTAFLDAPDGRVGVAQSRGGHFVSTPETTLVLLGAREVNAAEEQEERDYHRDDLAGDFRCVD